MELYYKENGITLIHGDCLEVMDKLINKNIKFDAIITDPPYGTTACSWDSVIPFEIMWEKLNKLSKENTPIVLFGSEPFSSYLRTSNINIYKYDWKWDKVVGSNFVNAKKMPLKVYEDIMVFYNKLPTYNPQMVLRDKAKHRVSGKSKAKINNITNMEQYEGVKSTDYAYPTTKIEINKRNGELNSKNTVHPTQKPVVLMEYLIRTYTNEGDNILDFTCGSGSTLVAAKNLNRKAVGIELEEKYYELAKKRIIDHSNCNVSEVT